MIKQIKISVRELVAFVLRSGSLTSTRFFSSRAVEGTHGHQWVQERRPAAYQTEVPVLFVQEIDNLELEISGRIDGLVLEADVALLEEIKTTRQPRPADAPENPVHWAQAKMYAHMIAQEHGLQEVRIQLTYVALDSWAMQEEVRSFSKQELAVFFDDMVTRYLEWARLYQEWCARRDASILGAEFPFPEFRKGQRQLALATFRNIVGGGRLYVEAPTGIGKTASTIFAALKAIPQTRTEKIFYLTAKTSGRFVAEETFARLRESGLRCKSLTLTARDKICFKEKGQTTCDPDQCEFAIGYYDRIDAALKEIFRRDDLTRQTIEETARRHRVCPFEFSLDLSVWADVIICDYNYLFDPRAYLRRFFQDGSSNYTLLVDEAHNLVDRGRDMYSAGLQKRDVLALKKAMGQEAPSLVRKLEKLNDGLREMGKQCEDGAEGLPRDELPRQLIPMLQDFAEAAEGLLSRRHTTAYYAQLIDFYYQVFGFLRVAELFDEHYVTYVEKKGRNVHVRLFCLDPKRNIAEALKRGNSATFFSATLTPLEYFRESLAGKKEDPLLRLTSPFPPQHLHLALTDYIVTTYRQRETTYADVAAAIAAVVDQKRGNYLIYFPSYHYMEAVAASFIGVGAQLNTERDVLVQKPGMTEPQRERFLSVFDAENARTTVGFAVMGGIFGEGVDLMGERLLGAVIVGVGLPQICLERDLIRAYYDERNLPGFQYAYTFPGMNRVLQAVGRVIRSETDRGVVLLIDRRFVQAGYQRLFPSHWHRPLICGDRSQISSGVESFWTSQDDLPVHADHGTGSIRTEPFD